jgi:purine-cytosine permease-like protein
MVGTVLELVAVITTNEYGRALKSRSIFNSANSRFTWIVLAQVWLAACDVCLLVRVLLLCQHKSSFLVHPSVRTVTLLLQPEPIQFLLKI